MCGNVEKCLDFDRIDCYRFVSDKRLYQYLKQMLYVGKSFDKASAVASNVTFICVHQNGKRQLKVFPWNQLLEKDSERQDLMDVLFELYGKNWRDLCYADVDALVPIVSDWDAFLQECVDFLTQMESQQFYPVILTIGNPKSPYLKIISLK